jgi:hypothetical protein
MILTISIFLYEQKQYELAQKIHSVAVALNSAVRVPLPLSACTSILIHFIQSNYAQAPSAFFPFPPSASPEDMPCDSDSVSQMVNNIFNLVSPYLPNGDPTALLSAQGLYVLYKSLSALCPPSISLYELNPNLEPLSIHSPFYDTSNRPTIVELDDNSPLSVSPIPSPLSQNSSPTAMNVSPTPSPPQTLPATPPSPTPSPLSFNSPASILPNFMPPTSIPLTSITSTTTLSPSTPSPIHPSTSSTSIYTALSIPPSISPIHSSTSIHTTSSMHPMISPFHVITPMYFPAKNQIHPTPFSSTPTPPMPSTSHPPSTIPTLSPQTHATATDTTSTVLFLHPHHVGPRSIPIYR